MTRLEGKGICMAGRRGEPVGVGFWPFITEPLFSEILWPDGWKRLVCPEMWEEPTEAGFFMILAGGEGMSSISVPVG